MSLDFSNFLDVQIATAWGRTLQDFADWCSPQPGWLVLDAGTGPGLLPALFSGMNCRAIGNDLNRDMFSGSSLHDSLCAADTMHLPFPGEIFDQLTACNLLFLLADPPGALQELARVTKTGGQLVTLNPSEKFNLQAAEQLTLKHNLEGTARDSLLNWAANAETHYRWSESQTEDLFRQAGLQLVESTLRVGPGFARYARGIKKE